VFSFGLLRIARRVSRHACSAQVSLEPGSSPQHLHGFYLPTKERTLHAALLKQDCLVAEFEMRDDARVNPIAQTALRDVQFLG